MVAADQFVPHVELEDAARIWIKYGSIRAAEQLAIAPSQGRMIHEQATDQSFLNTNNHLRRIELASIPHDQALWCYRIACSVTAVVDRYRGTSSA
jgi:hypothetical protein